MGCHDLCRGLRGVLHSTEGSMSVCFVVEKVRLGFYKS